VLSTENESTVGICPQNSFCDTPSRFREDHPGHTWPRLPGRLQHEQICPLDVLSCYDQILKITRKLKYHGELQDVHIQSGVKGMQ